MALQGGVWGTWGGCRETRGSSGHLRLDCTGTGFPLSVKSGDLGGGDAGGMGVGCGLTEGNRGRVLR